MLLDLFPRDQVSALEEYGRLPVLPRDIAGFSERMGLNAQDWLNEGASFSRARNEYNMWSDALDKLYQRTGREVPNPAAARPEARSQIEVMAREALAAARGEHPDLPNPDDFEAQIKARVQAEHKAATGAAQVSTFGGHVGGFIGSSAAIIDPLNIASMWLGAPRSVGILAFAAREALIAGGSQAAIEAVAAPYRAELGITDVSSLDAILGAAAGGAVLGGTARALVKLFDRLRLRGDVDVPPALRDARNTVEAAQRLEDSNPLPAVNLATHSEALTAAVEAVAEGRRVEVPAAVVQSGRAVDRAALIEAAKDLPDIVSAGDVPRELRARLAQHDIQPAPNGVYDLAELRRPADAAPEFVRAAAQERASESVVSPEAAGATPGPLAAQPAPTPAQAILQAATPERVQRVADRIDQGKTIPERDRKIATALTERAHELQARDAPPPTITPSVKEPDAPAPARAPEPTTAVPPAALTDLEAGLKESAKPEAATSLVANIARQLDEEDIQVPIDADGTTKSARALLQEAKDAKAAAREIDGCANGGSIPA